MTSRWIADASGRFVAVGGTPLKSYKSPSAMLPIEPEAPPKTDEKQYEPRTLELIAAQLKNMHEIFVGKGILLTEYNDLANLRYALQYTIVMVEKAQEDILRNQTS